MYKKKKRKEKVAKRHCTIVFIKHYKMALQNNQHILILSWNIWKTNEKAELD